ncbi:MAG: glucosaminidase domain-containing protein [Alphaproteobacteria bacterium]
MIKKPSLSIPMDIKKTALLWGLPVISALIIYKNFTDHTSLLFKVNKTNVVASAPKSVVKTKTQKVAQQKILSVNGLHTFNANTVMDIKKSFTEYNYDLKNNVVPRIQPNHMPKDLNTITDVKYKKEMFIKLMLPMAIDINNNIISKQKMLSEIEGNFNDNENLNAKDLKNLRYLGVKFGVKIKTKDIGGTIKKLKIKVQPIPVSLILAQAIVESGWGTSRFAILGNALFGQWTYNSKSDLIPINRDDGKTHSIKSFTSPYQSMKAYTSNINRNGAYKKLRAIRNNISSNNNKVTGTALADGLINYSQEREKYVKKIKTIIKSNNLNKYDTYTLGE